MKTKTMTVDLKADGDLKEGQFTGYAAVFGNKDSYWDVIIKGAFEDTLATYGENGAGVPVYWSHRMDDPMMNIGQTIEAKEDDHGLFVKVQLDLETPQGAQVHKLIKTGRVSQMSFAYDIQDSAWASSKELGEYCELRKLKLHEVSVVPVGANQETELLAVKDSLAAVKAGRKLSARNEEKLTKAHDLIGEVLATVEEESDQDASDEESKSAKPEEPETAKGEEPDGTKARKGNPDAALAHLNIIDMEGAL